MLSHWNHTVVTLKNIYKGNHTDNHTEMFSFDVHGHWNHTETYWKIVSVTGALDNILEFSFWLNFIYQVKIDC